MSRFFQLCTWSKLSSLTITRKYLGECSSARIVRAHFSLYSPPQIAGSTAVSITPLKTLFPSFFLYPSPLAAYGRGSFCAHASSAAFNFPSPCVSCARCASIGTPSTHNHPPSLPPCHVIPLLLQTAIDEARVGLVGLRRTGEGMEETGQEAPDRTAGRPDHRPQAG